MYRNKQGSEYYTLVGGYVNEGESIEQALVREVKEETGLDVTAGRLVFTEKHLPPRNDQYIFLCEVGPNDGIAIQDTAEEAFMNKIDINIHKPLWVEIGAFSRLPFFTIQLQKAIVESLQQGFPPAPVEL